MEMFEEAVMWYIAAEGQRFLCPQFPVGEDPTYPDFVALDFSERAAYVVEVTCHSDPSHSVTRVKEYHALWQSGVRSQLSALHPVFTDWPIFISVFVRGEYIERVTNALLNLPQVSVFSLDDVIFSWRWQWEGQRPNNVLKRDAQTARPL